MTELLLGNLEHFTKSPAEFYRWYHRRLVVAANDLEEFANWDHIRKCKDIRFKGRCGNAKICPYCWIRKIIRTVWSKWHLTPTEIYTFDDLDEEGFAILSDALTAVVGGVQWFRYCLPTDERRYAYRTIFLVPCGATLLRHQPLTFIKAFGIQREFLTAPVETWVGAVRNNLEGGSLSGMLGSVRGGKLHNLPLKPSLRDLHPGLYSTLTAQAIRGDDPEEEAATGYSPIATTEDQIFVEIAYLYEKSSRTSEPTEFQSFVDRASHVTPDRRSRVVAIVHSILQPATLEEIHEHIRHFRVYRPAGTFEDFLSHMDSLIWEAKRQSAIHCIDVRISPPCDPALQDGPTD